MMHYKRFQRYKDPLQSARSFNYTKLYREERWADLLLELKNNCEIDDKGCWNWQGTLHGKSDDEAEKYGFKYIAGKVRSIHRLTYFLQHNLQDVETTQTIHHKCTNPNCCNPEHLQLISQRENTAEMFERKYYKSRIAQLEAALAEFAPNHALLYIPEETLCP